MIIICDELCYSHYHVLIIIWSDVMTICVFNFYIYSQNVCFYL